MKKICIIAPDTFPVPAVKGGAVETVINNIIDENEKYKKLDIVCLSVYDKIAYKKSSDYRNTKFIYYRMPKLKLTNFIIRAVNFIIRKIFKKNIKYYIHSKRLYSKIRKMKFDYVIVEGGDAISYKYLTDKYDKDKVVLHMHGVDMSCKNNSILNEMYGKYIALNQFTQNVITKNEIIKKQNVYIVPNGIKYEVFNNKISIEEKLELKKKFGIQEDEKVILFCGRLIKEKGVLELIQSLQYIESKNKYKVLIVGNSQFGKNSKTDFEEKLWAIAKEQNEKIKFTGFIHNSQLYKIYQIADIFVGPSILEEAFGLVFLEAMASGLPIITTISGGIPELVLNEAGILLNRDEKLVENIAKSITKLLDDDNLRKNMGQSGTKIASKYDFKIVYDSLVDTLDRMEGKK